MRVDVVVVSFECNLLVKTELHQLVMIGISRSPLARDKHMVMMCISLWTHNCNCWYLPHIIITASLYLKPVGIIATDFSPPIPKLAVMRVLGH